MKVTIITVCYNRVMTIAEAMMSVLSQDYPDIEYLIIDGASTDGTTQLVRDMLAQQAETGATAKIQRHAREARLVSEPDNGMYEALNKGMRMATGDVIGLVHSDDVLMDTNIVSHYVESFKRTGADLIYADGVFVDKADTSRIRRLWVSGYFWRWKVRLGWLPLHPTVYIRRASLNPDVLYDTSYRVAADTKFLIYYLHESPLRVHYLQRYTVRMRMGGLSTDPKRAHLVYKEDVSIYQYYGFRFPRLDKVMKMMWKVPQFALAVIRQTINKIHRLHAIL